MINPAKLNKVWLILGAIFIAMGLWNLLAYGYLGSLLTIAVGGLIVYSSVYNMGGWQAAWYEILMMFGMNPYAKKMKIKKKKKNTW